MPRLFVSDRANEDLRNITRYIARDKPRAAKDWVRRIRKKCMLITKHPDIGDRFPDRDENIRLTYVGRYVIIFRRVADVVEIVRVVSGDQESPVV